MADTSFSAVFAAAGSEGAQRWALVYRLVAGRRDLAIMHFRRPRLADVRDLEFVDDGIVHRLVLRLKPRDARRQPVRRSTNSGMSVRNP